jgi:hypothetical protein
VSSALQRLSAEPVAVWPRQDIHGEGLDHVVNLSLYGRLNLGIYSQTLHHSHVLGVSLLSASSEPDFVEQARSDLYQGD